MKKKLQLVSLCPPDDLQKKQTRTVESDRTMTLHIWHPYYLLNCSIETMAGRDRSPLGVLLLIVCSAKKMSPKSPASS
mgnify:CR=1 FL=1